MRFKDRRHAGALLAQKLISLPLAKAPPVVLALSHGGVPVAFEIAKALRGEMDILLVKDDSAELGPRQVEGKVVILVDEGLVTGAAMVSAIERLKTQKPQKIVVAVPVGSQEMVDAVKKLADEVVVGHIPGEIWSAGLWYEDFKHITDQQVKELLSAARELRASGSDLERELRQIVQPLRSRRDIDPLIRKMSEARVVMLGEATHGTEEFYEWRKVISQKLIQDYGFSFIAVEGDWPDCFALNRYISEPDYALSAREVMSRFKRWPTWMWANHQVEELIEWMKGRSAGFYGLDVYSLNESLHTLKLYAKKAGGDLENKINAVYSCFEPYEKSEISYASAQLRYPHNCEEETVACLEAMLRIRIENTRLSQSELFDASQSALILKNAERYYRAMGQGDAESWNIRDHHMMDTLDMLLRSHGEGAKGIVWAHNTHIGDYRATDMVEDDYINIGGLARERYGNENVFLVGFGTHRGQVLAGRAWDAPPEIMAVHPAREGSIEHSIHEVADELNSAAVYLDLREAGANSALARPRGHRAIGVVYHSGNEARGRNYVPTDLRGRYDAFVFIDKTHALSPLAALRGTKGLIPELWPRGE